MRREISVHRTKGFTPYDRTLLLTTCGEKPSMYPSLLIAYARAPHSAPLTVAVRRRAVAPAYPHRSLRRGVSILLQQQRVEDRLDGEGTGWRRWACC